MADFSPLTTLLQGEPGCGKSRMACLTAIHKPVYVLDIDRKVASAGWARAALQNEQLFYWELDEPMDEENLKLRVAHLASKENQKASIAPQGWNKFAEKVANLGNDENFMKSNTLNVDSLTLLGEHFKSHLMWLVGKNKYTWDQWNAYKIGWTRTIDALRSVAKKYNKDLIMTVHERTGEAPGDRSTGVAYTTSIKDGEATRQREIKGTLDLKIWASIDGSFGALIGAQMDEYYHLYVNASDEKVEWKCRVWPDGRRPLRTSFMVKQAVFNPDFREIWK